MVADCSIHGNDALVYRSGTNARFTREILTIVFCSWFQPFTRALSLLLETGYLDLFHYTRCEPSPMIDLRLASAREPNQEGYGPASRLPPAASETRRTRVIVRTHGRFQRSARLPSQTNSVRWGSQRAERHGNTMSMAPVGDSICDDLG